MMGHSSESKAHRLFKPETNGIIKSRDIVFLEAMKVRLNIESEFYYSELIQWKDDANSGEGSNVIEIEPEIVSVSGKNVSKEDESDDDDADYFDSDEWSSPLPPPVEDHGRMDFESI